MLVTEGLFRKRSQLMIIEISVQLTFRSKGDAIKEQFDKNQDKVIQVTCNAWIRFKNILHVLHQFKNLISA